MRRGGNEEDGETGVLCQELRAQLRPLLRVILSGAGAQTILTANHHCTPPLWIVRCRYISPFLLPESHGCR